MKPKLLYVLTRPPYPAIDGTRERILGEIKALNADFEISLLIVTYENTSVESENYLKSIVSGEIFILKLRIINCYIRSFISLFSGNPMQAGYFYCKEAKQWLKKNCAQYQTIYFHTIRLGHYIKYLKNHNYCPNSRLLLSFNDSISLNYKSAKKKAEGLWRLIYTIEENRVKNYELEMLDMADGCSIITEHDKKYIEDNWKELNKNKRMSEIQIIPCDIDDTFFNYDYNPQNNNLVFIGNLFYPPNRQGLEFFCKNILPSIISRKPEIQLLIIGLGGKEFFSNIPNTKIFGFVDNPYPLMAQQALFVSPADFGAGVSSKSLLAMALGLPIISTVDSARGIACAKDGKNICLIDYANREDAVKKIIYLLENQEERKKIGQAGKMLALQNYRQSINYPKLKSFICAK